MISIPEGTSLALLLTDLAKRMGDTTYWTSMGLSNLQLLAKGNTNGVQLSLFWQTACAYLLMKACFNPLLSSHLQQEFPDEYDYFRAILLQQLEDRGNSFSAQHNTQAASNIRYFIKTGVARRTPLQEYLFEMKTNLELKMLAHLFGGTQILFPSPDGTGCIFLDGKDDKKKLETLYKYVADGLIIGLGYHWLAVQGMEPDKKNQYNFIIHDPLGTKKVVSSERIQSDFRFYAFQFDAAKRVAMDALVREALHLPKKKRV